MVSCLKPYLHYRDEQIALLHGDALEVAQHLGDGAVDCIVTSPPYFGLRDYGIEGQYGLESSPAEYIERMRVLFSELRRVLADDGTLWLNLGDSYSGGGRTSYAPTGIHANYIPRAYRAGGDRPGKNLMGIPWRVAFALQDDGWILRNAIIWHKPNAMPSSVTDRLGTRYEHVFLFSKSRLYWFDLDPIRPPARAEYHGTGTTLAHGAAESGMVRHGTQGSTLRARPKARPDQTNYPEGMRPQSARAATGSRHEWNDAIGRNPGDVWEIPTQPFSAAHFAVMPVALAQRCILAGCKPGGTVLDPFSGSGTTGLAAQRTGRKYVGIDINRAYLELSLRTRLSAAPLDFEAGAS